MVASLVISSRSRRRSSLTSRSSRIAPVRCPASTSGIARIETLAPREETSVRHGARPVTTSARLSSTGDSSRSTSVTIWASGPPTTSPTWPSRWMAEIALGLA